MKKLLYSLFFCFFSQDVNSQHWEGVGGGTDQTPHIVYNLYNWNNMLLVCGAFDSLGVPAIISHGTGYWNNQNWLSGNTSFVTGLPKCFASYSNNLIMGGGFGEVNSNQSCNKIARQDSTGLWSPLGSGITTGSVVNCMAVYNGDLFIGGQFTEVDSTIVARRIARWDGTSWHAMGSGFQGGFGNVNDMVVFQNELYVGGNFTSIDGLYAPGICKWNGTNWDTLGMGVNGEVHSLFVDSLNNRLYVGGYFSMVGGISCPTGVAYWDGQNWTAVGTNPFIPANVIFRYNGILYNLTFEFDAINSNGDTINYFAWFDGVNWNPVPGGELSSRGYAYAVFMNELYIGGSFQYAGDSLVNGIAKWIPGSLGIHESTEETFTMKLTPNPARDEVVLEFMHNESARLTLKVTDTGGKTIITEPLSTFNRHLINTSRWESGMYFINVYHADKCLGSEKVIITR